MADYSQIAFAVTVDDSQLTIYLAGKKLGTIPIDAVPPPFSTYLRPDGVSRYLRPDDVSTYIRP